MVQNVNARQLLAPSPEYLYTVEHADNRSLNKFVNHDCQIFLISTKLTLSIS